MNTNSISLSLNGYDVINGWEETPYEIGLLENMLWNVDVDVSVENDGIGSYECWGFFGYDAGTDHVSIDCYDSLIVGVHLHSIPFHDLSVLNGFVIVSALEDALCTEKDISVDESRGISARVYTNFKLLYGNIVDEDAFFIFEVQWVL